MPCLKPKTYNERMVFFGHGGAKDFLCYGGAMAMKKTSTISLIFMAKDRNKKEKIESFEIQSFQF